MNRTAVALFIVGVLTFFATAATLWRLQQADVPAPQAKQVDQPAPQGAAELRLAEAKVEAARQ